MQDEKSLRVYFRDHSCYPQVISTLTFVFFWRYLPLNREEENPYHQINTGVSCIFRLIRCFPTK